MPSAKGSVLDVRSIWTVWAVMSNEKPLTGEGLSLSSTRNFATRRSARRVTAVSYTHLYWIGKAAQTVTIRNQTVVACAETIFENASFRVPIRRRRCLIPVSGFFGWHHGQAQKTPYYVTVKDRPVIALAGVFDCWIDRDSDEVVMTYSVITKMCIRDSNRTQYCPRK